MTAGLVREQEAGLQAFLALDGFSVLMRGMQSENEKLRTKSAFLLLNLLTSHPEQKGTNKEKHLNSHSNFVFFYLKINHVDLLITIITFLTKSKSLLF